MEHCFEKNYAHFIEKTEELILINIEKIISNKIFDNFIHKENFIYRKRLF